MKAFVWHSRRGTLADHCILGVGENSLRQPIFGSQWPNYGFDEWFLLAAVFPRLAFEGVSTFFPKAGDGNFAPNHWFGLDVEYVTWANPKSELIYFGPDDHMGDKALDRRIDTPAESRVLKEMLAEKSREKRKSGNGGEVLRFPGSGNPATLVVARYREDLD